jgi:hypothetical protein
MGPDTPKSPLPRFRGRSGHPADQHIHQQVVDMNQARIPMALHGREVEILASLRMTILLMLIHFAQDGHFARDYHFCSG